MIPRSPLQISSSCCTVKETLTGAFIHARLDYESVLIFPIVLRILLHHFVYQHLLFTNYFSATGKLHNSFPNSQTYLYFLQSNFSIPFSCVFIPFPGTVPTVFLPFVLPFYSTYRRSFAIFTRWDLQNLMSVWSEMHARECGPVSSIETKIINAFRKVRKVVKLSTGIIGLQCP